MNERRKHPRVAGLMVSGTTVRVRAGCDGTLLNMSPGGALIEIRRPMRPGACVDLQLSNADTRSLLRALVLRYIVRSIAALDGVTYEAALAFENEADLGREGDARNGYVVPTDQNVQRAVCESELPDVLTRPTTVANGCAK
ncbi:MAG TPA: PilZ domain-containing protein [Vicinamibacterales bacterium]|nr:PilZ domain-containing protein [Vicinamibacterales bacterium]